MKVTIDYQKCVHRFPVVVYLLRYNICYGYSILKAPCFTGGKSEAGDFIELKYSQDTEQPLKIKGEKMAF